MQHLVDTSTDGYLLPTSRKAARVDDVLGKRFAWIRSKLGFDAKDINLHTYRNTFIAAMVNSGVPQHLNAVVVGHALSEMTYTYAPANSMNWSLLTDAVAQVSLGDFDKTTGEIVQSIIK